MTTAEEKRGVVEYRVKRLLMQLADTYLLDIIEIEKETGYQYGRVVELAREELARREQPGGQLGAAG